MGDVTHGNHHRVMTDEELIDLYEQLRAAEKNPELDYPFSGESMKVNIDWGALERRALSPSLPERVRRVLISIPPRLLAASIIVPILGLLGIFFWLRDVPVGVTEEFAVAVTTAAASMVLMFMWSGISLQAMDKVVRMEERDEVLRSVEAETAPPLPAGRPVFQPIRLLGSPHAATFTFFVTAAVVTIGAVMIALPPKKVNAAEEAINDAATRFRQDDVQGGTERVEVVLNRTAPSRNRKVFYTAADLAYDELMSLRPRTPEADTLRETLTRQALKALLAAKRDNPKSATVWTRLAEVYFLEGDLENARASIERVNQLKDVPPLEMRRAQMIAGFINARDISTHVKPSQERMLLAKQLDQAIRSIKKSSEEAGTDASAVLTHLYLARAGATDDPKERAQRREEAIALSVEAINAATVLRAVERPQSLTRQFGLTAEPADHRTAVPEQEVQ